MGARTLVFGWGNPSRGDDALGPLAVAAIEGWAHPDVDCLTDYQLQVEHALDLVGRDRVLFVDATLAADAGDVPFTVTRLAPAADASYTTHEMSPAAVLHVLRHVLGRIPPPAWLLAVAGTRFDLGAPTSGAALTHLDAALAWARDWLADPAQSRDSASGGPARSIGSTTGGVMDTAAPGCASSSSRRRTADSWPGWRPVIPS